MEMLSKSKIDRSIYMKTIRPEFDENEYARLREEADRLGVSVKQLVRDRVLGIVTEDTPLCSAKILSDGISAIRETMNQIIKNEMDADVRLYEDDVIRLEQMMVKVEKMVGSYITWAIREAKANGDIMV